MGFIAGLIAIAVAILATFLLRAKNGLEKSFARNWLALIGVTMAIMTLFIAGVAAVITNWS